MGSLPFLLSNMILTEAERARCPVEPYRRSPRCCGLIVLNSRDKTNSTAHNSCHPSYVTSHKTRWQQYSKSKAFLDVDQEKFGRWEPVLRSRSRRFFASRCSRFSSTCNSTNNFFSRCPRSCTFQLLVFWYIIIYSITQHTTHFLWVLLWEKGVALGANDMPHPCLLLGCPNFALKNVSLRSET